MFVVGLSNVKDRGDQEGTMTRNITVGLLKAVSIFFTVIAVVYKVPLPFFN